MFPELVKPVGVTPQAVILTVRSANYERSRSTLATQVTCTRRTKFLLSLNLRGTHFPNVNHERAATLIASRLLHVLTHAAMRRRHCHSLCCHCQRKCYHISRTRTSYISGNKTGTAMNGNSDTCQTMQHCPVVTTAPVFLTRSTSVSEHLTRVSQFAS
jgi:hypothetical protein